MSERQAGSKSSRGRILLLLAATQVALLAFLSFDWLGYSFKAKTQVVELGTLTGSALYPAANALITLAALAFILFAISRGRSQYAFAVVELVANLGGSSIALLGILRSDVSAQKSQVSNWINIAAAHDVTNLDVSQSPNAILFAIATVLNLTVWAAMLPNIRKWPAKAPRQSREAQPTDETAIEDAFTLWESQRASSER